MMLLLINRDAPAAALGFLCTIFDFVEPGLRYSVPNAAFSWPPLSRPWPYATLRSRLLPLERSRAPPSRRFGPL
jgi:hypothetical protein